MGLSFSNAWLCLGLSFGVRGESARVGRNFILGRFLGIVGIGIAVSAAGAVLEVPPIYFVAAFGIGSILFGLAVLLGALGGPGPLRRRLRHSLGLQKGCERAAGEGGRLEGVKPKTAFLLGVLRGATPCVKLMVLAPLLIAIGPWNALAVTFVYAATSTAYPVIGFLLASTLSHLPRWDRALKVAGAVILVGAGVLVILSESLRAMAPRGD